MRKILCFFPLAVVFLSIFLIIYESNYSLYFKKNSTFNGKTSYKFSPTLKGLTRYYNEKNLRLISPESKSIPYKHSINKNYGVALYKKGFFYDEFIGAKILFRDKKSIATWENLNSGDYYLYFFKDNDGIFLLDNNVFLENY